MSDATASSRRATPGAPAFLDKIALRADAPARVARLPGPVVFTNGVFDVLHRGHVT